MDDEFNINESGQIDQEELMQYTIALKCVTQLDQEQWNYLCYKFGIDQSRLKRLLLEVESEQ